MIINGQKGDNVQILGENTSKRATIDETKLAKLNYILTEGLYTDPISATIVELTNNATDSIIESGKDPIKHPVVVTLGRTAVGYVMTIKDEGVGMDAEFFETQFMSMLTSTKEESNTQIGAFGIG